MSLTDGYSVGSGDLAMTGKVLPAPSGGSRALKVRHIGLAQDAPGLPFVAAPVRIVAHLRAFPVIRRALWPARPWLHSTHPQRSRLGAAPRCL